MYNPISSLHFQFLKVSERLGDRAWGKCVSVDVFGRNL